MPKLVYSKSGSCHHNKNSERINTRKPVIQILRPSITTSSTPLTEVHKISIAQIPPPFSLYPKLVVFSSPFAFGSRFPQLFVSWKRKRRQAGHGFSSLTWIDIE